MRYSSMLIASFLFLASFGAKTSSADEQLPENAKPYLGVFQHTVPEYKYVGDKVEFRNHFGSLYMNYEGIENFGDHGAGYYLHASYVQPSGDGSISFEIPARTLYSDPVRSGKFLTVRTEESKPVRFSGRIENGKLVLSCNSEDEYACFDEKLVFTRLK